MEVDSFATVLTSVIRPTPLASRLVQGLRYSVAGSNKDEIARDRRCGEYSAPSLVLPQDPAAGCGPGTDALVVT